MHLMFFALLVFGVSWQKHEPEAMIVDLWNNLPPVPAPKAEPAPPEVKPEPPKPRPEPKVEAKPVPKAEPKAVPKPEPKPVAKAEPKPTVKPDIALHDKKEKERKAQEQALAEKKAREQDEALKKLAQQQATAQAKLIDEYKRRIADKIKRFIVEPGNLQGNPEVELDVVLLPGGEVLGVKTRRASTLAAWDTAVERA